MRAHTSQAIRSPAALLTFTASMVGSPLEPAALKAQGLGSDVARCMWGDTERAFERFWLELDAFRAAGGQVH